jgi:hypothetical protein
MHIFNRLLLLFSVLALAISCAAGSRSGQTVATKAQLEELISGRSYEIQATWAYPLMTQAMTSVANSGLLRPGSIANRIDLIGNPNYFKVQGDSVRVSLPYFGERQIGGGYADRNEGIRFDGIPQAYTVAKEEGKTTVDIKIIKGVETLRFNLFLFPSGRADINMNSSHRSTIRYSGSVVQLTDRRGKERQR